MISTSARITTLALTVLAVSPTTSRAQDTQPQQTAATQEGRSGDLTISYQYFRFFPGGGAEGQGFPLGFQASYVLNFTDRYGLVVDAGWSTKTTDTGLGTYNLNFSTYQAGLALRGSDAISTRLMAGIARVGVDDEGDSLGAANDPTAGIMVQNAGKGFTFGLGGGAIFSEGQTGWYFRLTAGWTF